MNQATTFTTALSDNATGCGILLELARAFASPAKSPNEHLFAAVTAEEQGLLGSKYLGEHPPVPAQNISLDLNYDDIEPVGEPQQVVVSGAERTSVYPLVRRLRKILIWPFSRTIILKPDTTTALTTSAWRVWVCRRSV